MDQKIAVAAGAWYQSTAVDRSRLMLYALPHPDGTLEALEEAIENVLADIVQNGVDEHELRRAKTRLIADTVYAQDSQSSLARMYGSALATGSSLKDVTDWPDAIDAVSAEVVQKVTQKWLNRRHVVSGYLLKDEAA